MKLFDENNLAIHKKRNKMHWILLCCAFVFAVAICVVFVCLENSLGRVLCQTVATVVTIVFGCFTVVCLRQISLDNKLIAMHKKLLASTITTEKVVVNNVDDYTTTVEGVTFVALEVVGEKEKILYLYGCENCKKLQGKELLVKYAHNVIVDWGITQ